MRYTESPPPLALARHVKCLWRFQGEAGEQSDRIVPDGRPELIVHLGAPFAEAHGDATAIQPRVLLAGQLTQPLRLRATGAADVIGVRFHPHGARAFAGRSMREVTDRRIAIEGLALSADADPAESAARLVAQRIAATAAPEDALVASAVQLIESSAGTIDIPALVAESGIGRRQLERRFADVVGIGPALLASIFRFRSVFDVVERGSARPWTEAALAAGYYDQSHFIREFRRFVGCTPTEFEAARSGLASALVEA